MQIYNKIIILERKKNVFSFHVTKKTQVLVRYFDFIHKNLPDNLLCDYHLVTIASLRTDCFQMIVLP